MTNSVAETEFNDLLFVIGSNATEAHPIIGNKMKRAVTQHGAKLIVVDPRHTELAALATHWLRITPGTDVALVNAMINIIVTEGWMDKQFVEERCEGFDKMWSVVETYTPERAEEITGIPVEQIYEAAKLYANTKEAGIYYTLGITEHTTGTENVMSLANLAMVTGHLGLENSGVNPLRGQNNVQGACDMGALPDVFPGYQSIFDKEAVSRFEEAWGATMNKIMGLRIPEMIDLAADGEVKAMYVMGEDPVLTDPDTNHVRKALANLDFMVAQDLFMTETAKYADAFLPAACYAEKDGTFTNTERRVQMVRKAVDAPGECRLDWEIICEIAKRMGYEMEYASAEEIFDEMRGLTPSYKGMTYERIGNQGLQWPCPTLDHPGTRFLHKGTFPKGKGVMKGIEYKPAAELTCEEYPVLLTTGRMLYHYNIMTRHSDNLNNLRPHELAEINPKQAAELGVATGDEIRVTSRRGTIVTKVLVTDKVAPGIMFMTFHYHESPVNALTNSAFDPISKTAEYKVCAVKIEKLAV